ncbi:MAG: DNA mismatch repair protein MutS [Alphaproteobacteria bacterium]|nr:DNA mismatch repair protein MutS [Alphaproteobacteria bacterium]
MPVVQASFLPPEPAAEPAAVTPLMAQYLSVKERHKECLLFFRLGDFYELFFDDAVTAAKCLDIALTRRGQHQGNDVPMCGVPAHSYEGYLAKLIRAGHRVAICEQQESPEDAKKRAKGGNGKSIVTRDVVRIITPGTLTEDNLLDARAANYLACLTSVGDDIAVAWCDIVSGHIYAQQVLAADMAGVLARLDASEILAAQRVVENPDLYETLAPWRAKLSAQPNGRFDSDNARRRMMDIYGVGDIAAFGDFSRAEIAALGALLDYVELTQKSDLSHFARPQRMGAETVAIDAATRRNLELTRTLSGDRRGSLLDSIDRTETGAGARLLASRLVAPLTDIGAINERLDGVAFFTAASPLRGDIRAALRRAPDLERALARLVLGRGGPRDLAAVRDALAQAETIRSALLAVPAVPAGLRGEVKNLGEHNGLIDKLGRALAADLPMLARDGNFIARGYAAQLDELVTLRDDGKRVIAGLQQKYAMQSGVPTLKIKHNQVIGYHIDVTPAQADKLLADKDTFIHRQTLATAARFTTVELSELERKITEAGDKALAVELQLFGDLVGDVTQRVDDLRAAAQALAALDVAAALAELAVEQNYARPAVDASLAFDIAGGRHPVVEQALRAQGGAAFIANACDLGPDQRLWLLTGPNMAGKSTFLRQNALIALLAQTGSFVPAAAAHIGVIDRLFSRVGAADDLAAGRSTFMVEMVETAAILTQASDRALVILDEIGRGTATYDGLSIAWAVLEYLHGVNKCRGLFATHYHELTALARDLPALRCATMRIREWGGKIVFMHEVVDGVADRSYGIHVAQMAGLPAPVIARAEQVLSGLEEAKAGRGSGATALPAFDPAVAPAPKAKPMTAELESILSTLDPDGMSPKQALEALYRIKSAV